VLGSLPWGAVPEFLLERADQGRREFIDQQALLDLLTRLQTLQRASTLPELVRQAAARFGERAAEAVAALGEPGRWGLRAFLLEALTLVLEGKTARYTALVSETAQQVGGPAG